jgi:membrane associated rhomboid family serine protease
MAGAGMAPRGMTTRARTLWRRALLLLALLACCTVVLAADALTGGALVVYGVQPRSTIGLRGIVFAPFLHGGWGHLAANSVPFLTLGGLILLHDVRRFATVSLFAMVGAGLAAWLLGAPRSVHIGASGVVFGYLGFLLAHGWFAKRLGSALLSVAIAVIWGGLLFGVLPGQPGMSWESHAGGLVGGLYAARQAGPGRQRRSPRRR